MTTSLRPSVAVFGAYDIRGRYPEEFSPDVRRRLAHALVRFEAGDLVVARDSRRESARLELGVVSGLRAAGRTVLRLGVQPTPVVGFASASLRTMGLAFTPSHNPAGYGGIKAFGPSGRSLGPEWARVRRLFVAPAPSGGGRARTLPNRAAGPSRPPSAPTLVARYVDHVTRGLTTTRSIVIDSRGGATSLLAPRALRRLGARTLTLHPGFSPNFHGLSPEPRPEDVGELGRAVRSRGADLGITFDGDGDRVAFVDGRGRWVEPEVVATLLHRHLSSEGRPLVASADASQRCESMVETVRSRIGSRYVSAEMRRHRSDVGFEASSHFYLRRWGPNSDGILVGCVVADLLDREATPLETLVRAFGPIVRDRQQLGFAGRPAAARYLRRLVAAVRPRLRPGIDGWVFRRVEGTVLLRLSNTQPVIRLLLEPNRDHSLAALRRAWDQARASAPPMRTSR